MKNLVISQYICFGCVKVPLKLTELVQKLNKRVKFLYLNFNKYYIIIYQCIIVIFHNLSLRSTKMKILEIPKKFKQMLIPFKQFMSAPQFKHFTRYPKKIG